MGYQRIVVDSDKGTERVQRTGQGLQTFAQVLMEKWRTEEQLQV